jgi:hypothetical protein
LFSSVDPFFAATISAPRLSFSVATSMMIKVMENLTG